jgi:DNA-binding transcriptional regulator LsrR (DeoR family)
MTRPKTYDEEQLLIVASLYYIDGLNQNDIAKRFRVSRPTVVRMLKEVRQQGLIEIKLTKKLPHTRILAAEIESRYADSNLNEVIVIDENDLSKKMVVARAAAAYLENTILETDILGVGWSTTLAHLHSFIVKPNQHPKMIVQLAGATGGTFGSNAQEISINLSQTMHAPVSQLASPIFLANENARDAILKDRGVQETIALFSKCTVAVIGVGDISNRSTLIKSGYLTKADMAELTKSRVVGDILVHFFDENGDEVETTWDKLRISASREQVKNIDNVVAVSAGATKSDAVKSALKGGYINTLIIDLSLAKALVKK